MENESATILVTGAGGFIGTLVVNDLAGRDTLCIDGEAVSIGRIIACDVSATALQPLDGRSDKIETMAGDLADPDTRQRIADLSPTVIVHLAAVVSSAAEADFDLGLTVNVRSVMDLLLLLESANRPPVFLFTSSVAVFATDDNATITESEEPKPLSSYGTQKVIGELLVRDATRRGIIRGRTIRFPTISVRPGVPNKAASSFASGIIREPLKGEASVLPVARHTRLHLASPENAVAAVCHALSLEQASIGNDTTITLPGLAVTVDEMIATLEEVAGTEVVALISEQPDPAIAAIVSTWPGEIDTPRAESLGFSPDAHFEDLITGYRDRESDAGPTDRS